MTGNWAALIRRSFKRTRTSAEYAGGCNPSFSSWGAALWIILAVSAIRLLAGARYPLTPDESYYWVWSRHLAYGYTDHPPMVAWLIALTSVLGKSPLAVRLPFIVCEAIAAFAAGRAAIVLSSDDHAGAAAALAVLLIPQGRLAVGEALPDGPYLAAWALALWSSAQLSKRPSLAVAVALGLALGGTLLSRFFGWALVCGLILYALAPQRRALWRQGLWLSLLIALALYAPFLVWNAHHGWSNFAFTFAARQPVHGFSAQRLQVITSLRLVLFAALFWVVAYFTILRPRFALLGWTALLFPTAIAALSFFQTTESYYILGPLISLCVAIGIAYARQSIAWRRILLILALIPATYTMIAAVFVGLPEAAQATALRASGGALKGPFFSQAFAFTPLAQSVQRLSNGEPVFTDRLEIAAQLTYHGVPSSIVGGAPQVAQWTWWYGDRIPERVLLVTFDPIAKESDFGRRIIASFASVSTGPTLQFRFAG
ncbi:MAG: glycosyltransferase family 39 protein, partial [Candidatus Eremiobacteraeota bacterium]|nr:glycosyltransferase family 39 protein [Candidatus Eremiobacteraeota bacterium]